MKPLAGQADPIARAARSVALRVGAMTAIVALLVIIGAGFIFDRQQLGEITSRVETAALTADDVVDAPPGVWLVDVSGPTPRLTAGTPSAVGEAAVLVGRSGVVTGSSGETSLLADGRSWPAWVAQRGERTFVAVYDMRLHSEQERRLISSAAIAGGIGVLLAALTGLLAGRRAVRPLAEALDLQRQFVADASHELRTPLAVISTRAQMLRRHLPAGTPSATRAEADQLIVDTKAMAGVLADLLLSAQLEHGEAERDSVDVGALVTEVVISLEPYAAESGVHLTAATAPAGPDLVVAGVSSSLRRALVALIDNAIAHSSAASTVTVGLARAGPDVRVDVIDHGAGVETSDLDQLTHRFARARNDGSHRRVGLGLALVTQIVRSHGGRLDVSDTPGGGATFSLVLPAE